MLRFSSPARFDLTFATLGIAFTLGACSSAIDLEDADFRDDEPTAQVCHTTPGFNIPKTISVELDDVEDHLAHGDTLGPCPTPCNLLCDDLATNIGEACNDAPPGLFPDGFCDAIVEVIESSCDDSCPEPTAETCNDFCAGIADQALEACWESLPDPMICDFGAQATYQECTQVFECPPPPPTCHDICEQNWQAAHEECMASGGDPACFEAADAEMFACHDSCCVNDCSAGCTDMCGDDPECAADCNASCEFQCQPPPGPQCWEDCFQQYDAAWMECDATGGDPACYEQVDMGMNTCTSGCCVEDCSFMCGFECGGDPECQADCSMQCEQGCLPPEPCDPETEQTCWDGSCVPFGGECPQPGCWDQCWMDFDDAIMACEATGADPACFEAAEQAVWTCDSGCCTEDCSMMCEDICMGDPACTDDCSNDCAQMCLPPEPCPEETCWDGSCVPFGEACPPPGCWEQCWIDFDAALMECDATGGDPACYEAAEQGVWNCEGGCCAEDCGMMCEDMCMGDPACMDDCNNDCDMMCLPPEPCPEQTCWDGTCVGFGEVCPSEPPPPPYCDPFMEEFCPDGTCVPLGEPCP